MTRNATYLLLAGALALGTLTTACNNNKNKETTATENTASGAASQESTASQDVAKVNDDNIKDQLKQANLNDVGVHVDNDKKVINLTGDVASADQKNQAESIAKQHAAGYVVSNEIGVRPENDKTNAKKVNSNLDDAIKSDFKAMVAQNNWSDQHIRSDVKNGVLTLKGDVDTQDQRTAVEQAASKIQHVRQVVNELGVKEAGK